jgi:hypothetical protein
VTKENGEIALSGLEGYAGTDLRALSGPDTAEFWKLFGTLTGDEHDPQDVFNLWGVDRFGSGRAAWLVLEAYPGLSVPDVSVLRVHLFDCQWKRFATQIFPTGYRFFLKEAKVSRDASLKTDLLVTRVECSGPFRSIDGGPWRPAFEQAQYQWQYYALVGEAFVMVRLEDDEGRPVRNGYCARTPFKGPPAPSRTAEQWTHALRSTSPVEQLASLVWLTGVHLSSKEPRLETHNQESLEDSLLFEEVGASPNTVRALAGLRKSKNQWVRQYGQLGVVPPRGTERT